ncbi:MAG TPA: DUF2785 domain-containing protein, partial [Anaerolineales bacterium]|nr:DUF2785 domain-containing protein [Anaerolineales bacterium]
FIKVLLANLDTGIGETENDSIFLRTFSILFLAEIIHNDNKKPTLDKEEVTSILEKSLWYVTAEMDPRGYIPVKGWAHALAHAADLLRVLGKNKHLEEKDLLKILNTISAKFIGSINYIYIHGEDERLASAVMQALRRGLLSIEKVETWSKSFIDHDWKGAYTDEKQNRAFQNTRNLLRSIYLELIKDEVKINEQDSLEKIFLDTLNNLKTF